MLLENRVSRGLSVSVKNFSLISEVTLEFEVYSTDSSSPISKKMSGGMGAQASQLSQLQYLSGRAQSTI